MRPNYVATGADACNQDAYPIVRGGFGNLSDSVLESLVHFPLFRHADFQHPWGKGTRAVNRRDHLPVARSSAARRVELRGRTMRRSPRRMSVSIPESWVPDVAAEHPGSPISMTATGALLTFLASSRGRACPVVRGSPAADSKSHAVVGRFIDRRVSEVK